MNKEKINALKIEVYDLIENAKQYQYMLQKLQSEIEAKNQEIYQLQQGGMKNTEEVLNSKQ